MKLRALSSTLHLWLGLTVGGFLALMGLTGSMLVFSDEIEAALHPGLHRVEAGVGRASVDGMLETARRALPGEEAARFRMPDHADEAVQVWFGGSAAPRAYLDPYTGRLLGTQDPMDTPTGFLFELHAKLLSGETGERVVGTGAVVLLLLGLTGAVLWWPGWRNVRKGFAVKWGAAWKRVNYDLHRAGGILSLVFLLAMSLTGASLVFHEAFMGALNAATRSAPRPVAPVVAPPAAGERLPLDSLLRAADRAFPEGRYTYVTLPAKAEAPLVVRKKLPEELHPNGRTFLYVDPYTARVLAVEDARTTPRGTRMYNVLYPVHIGEFGGTATRALWVLLGLSPALLFATGFYIWWGKLSARRARERGGRKAAPRPRSAPRRERREAAPR